jgi:hypothetical protein
MRTLSSVMVVAMSSTVLAQSAPPPQDPQGYPQQPQQG